MNKSNNSYVFTASSSRSTDECEFEEKLLLFSRDFSRQLSALRRLEEKVENSQTEPIETWYLFLLVFQGQIPSMTAREQLYKQLIKIEKGRIEF